MYIVFYFNVFNNISLYKSINFIHSFMQLNKPRTRWWWGSTEDSYKVFLQRDRPQREIGQGRGDPVYASGLKYVWVLFPFFILGWPHLHPWLRYSFIGFRLSNLRFLLSNFSRVLSRSFNSLLDISTEKSHSFLKYNRFKTELKSFYFDFLFPSFLITEFGTFYMSSLLVYTHVLRPQILF